MLANIYLNKLDRICAARGSTLEGWTASGEDANGGLARWEGDLWVFGLHDSKETEHTTEPAHALMQRWPSPKAMKRVRERVHELTDSRHSRKDGKQIIATLNPVLRGWGNYRSGNAERKFNQLDSYVYTRLTRWMIRRGGQRTGRFEKWTHDRFVGMGLYRLRGTAQ